MNIGPVKFHVAKSGELFYANSKIGKNYSAEIILLGFRPAWWRQLVNITAEFDLNKKHDHTPSFHSMIYGLGCLLVEFNFNSIHHAVDEEDEKAGVEWRWVEADKTWYADFPVEVNGVKGVWKIWLTQRPGYCDRGRWSVGVDGIYSSPPDEQEGFPRYYFDLETAKYEMREWVKMRTEILANRKKP